MKDITMSEQKSDLVEFDTGEKKWNAQQIGVNSDTPLVDAGTGQEYIVRQFLFSFNPETAKKIKEKKMAPPTAQELFNSNWNQLRVELWKDGLVAVQENEYPPKIVIGKKRYKIILVCKARQGVMVANKVNKLQDILKPKRLTDKN